MSYLVRLQNFFMKHDPDRLYLAKRIARAFRNDEDAVMNRLEEIYAKGGPKKLKVKEITAPTKKVGTKTTKPNDEAVEDEVNILVEEDVNPKKSKKKLFIILGLVLALAGGGVGFYLTMGDNTSHDSETHTSDSTHEDHNTDPKTVDEIEEVIEQAEKDSVANELIEAGKVLEILH